MMKRRIAWLLVLLMAISLASCGSQPAAGSDGSEDPQTGGEMQETGIYDAVLDRYALRLRNGIDDSEMGEGESGVWEIIGAMGEKAGDAVGYTLFDISGDGVPELVIGDISEPAANGEKTGLGSQIYACYTAVDGTPQLVFEGWGRNGYWYAGENRIFNLGSGGAMYTIFGMYALSEDGTTLECTDYYFTYELDENFEEIGFFHNTTGEWDPDASEQLDVDEEAFWMIEEEMDQQIRNMELTPFSSYELSGTDGDTGNIGSENDPSQVSVAWEDEAASQVRFSAEKTVRDFKVLGLTFLEGDDSERIAFAAEELCAVDALTPEEPLVQELLFGGAIPNCGFSYVDEAGTERAFTVEVSGMDASLLTQPLTVEGTEYVL